MKEVMITAMDELVESPVRVFFEAPNEIPA
jgi:hypothetical protein